MAKKGDKSTIKDWLKVLAALSDDIAVLVIIFVLLWFFKVKLPLAVMIFIGLVLATVIFVVNRAVLLSLRRKKVTGAEGMVGLVGKVVRPLKPGGVIKVGSEYWQAKSLNGNIGAGEKVEIMGIDGLHLEVRRKIS